MNCGQLPNWRFQFTGLLFRVTYRSRRVAVKVSTLCRPLGLGAVGMLALLAAAGGSAPIAGAGGTPLSVSATFDNGSVGAAYTGGSVSASGGSGTYRFVASGLPPGIRLAHGGFAGKPTTVGDYSVTVSATDTSKPTHLAGSTTATFVVDPGQPTLTLTTYMPRIALAWNEVLTAIVHGTAKGQPDTGAITFTANGSPITCATTVTMTNETKCTLKFASTGTYAIVANDSGDVNYDAASAAGQVSVYK
jgi:hypothetical protein